MITGRRAAFEARCRERGVDVAAASACIVNEMGPIITVDETHSAYPKAKPLSLTQKAVNFAKATAQHVAAGVPRCTDEQVASRHAICLTCEFLKDGACEKCGCPVIRERAYISKLSWAGESCPVGKWGPVSPAG
jgi:hypothetical protein